jgi:acyl-CoA thioester hydrolase
MKEDAGPPILVFTPFVSSTMRVESAWIDYNGHMNMAYYLVLFDRAVDEALALVGLGERYVADRGCSYFTAEIHTVYLRELAVDEEVRVTLQLVDHDEKRIHAYLEIRHHRDGWIAASCEKMFLHVAMEERKVTAFPDDILLNLAAMKAAHAGLPRPDRLGRSIGIKPRRKGAGRAAPATSRTRH